MILKSGELDKGSAFERAMELRNELLPKSTTCLLTAIVVVASWVYPNYIVPRTEEELYEKFDTLHRRGAVDESMIGYLIEVAGFQAVEYRLLMSAAKTYNPPFNIKIGRVNSVQELFQNAEYAIADSFFSGKTSYPNHSDPWCSESEVLRNRILTYAQREGRKFAGAMVIKPKYNINTRF